jgi:hypothetical protein
VIPGAEHGEAHATDPTTYESAVTTFLRGTLGPETWPPEADPIIATPGQSQSDTYRPVDVPDPTSRPED